MLSKRDIRIIMLYEFKRGTNATKTTQNINEAFGEDVVSTSTVQRWFKKFNEGNENLENEDRGRPCSTVDNDELRAVVEADPRQTLGQLAEALNVSTATLDKWIPHELNDYQKNRRFEICSSLILRNKNDPFLDRIVTCDEKWILYDNRKRSEQWLDINEAPKSFPKPQLNQKKVMVTVWWSAEGIIHYEFLKPGETITAESYCQQIEEMHKKLCQKRPALVNRKGPILLHDNARPHVSKKTLQKLGELGYETLPHPAYSPDLAPTDFHFFKHLDHFLNEKIFNNEEDIKTAFEDFIASRSQDFYQNGINKMVSRWQQCIDSTGSYF
uniref:Mos1 transposase HTH domain-containing protein n=1 Tax=Strongyloides stercoralis TaxID=6248 RepID=A0AAF5DCR7_STRER